MRTTLNIDDRLLRHMKVEAQRAGISLTQLANQALELGLQRLAPVTEEDGYELPSFSMGQVTFQVDKALSFVADLEDEEFARKQDSRN